MHVWKVKHYGTFCRWCGHSAEEYKTADKGMREAMDTKCEALQKNCKAQTRKYKKENSGKWQKFEQLSLTFTPPKERKG